MHKNTKMLLPLTSLRFFAASAIVLLHASDYQFGLPRWIRSVDLNQGVSFFFILSGFILSYVYAEVRKGETAKFLLARFARLWPAHVATGLLVIAIAPARISSAEDQAPFLLIPLAQLLMVHAWIPVKEFYASLNSVSWSISTEFFFYLLFPFLRSRTARQLAACFALSFTVVLGVVWAGHVAELPVSAGDGQLSLLSLLYISPVCRILEFMGGMLTYRLYHRYALGKETSNPARSTGVELGALGLLAGAMLLSVHTNVWLAETSTALSIFTGMYGITLPFFALFIYVMARGAGGLSRLLSHPGLVLLGEISYAMYLLHLPLLWLFQDREPPFWVYGLILLAGSYAIWRWVEKPLRRLIVTRGSDWLDKAPAGAAAAPALLAARQKQEP